jgi:hypothetical protein
LASNTDGTAASYTVVAKHDLANESYDSDSDASAIYVYPRTAAANALNTPGTVLATVVASTINTINFGGVWVAQ